MDTAKRLGLVGLMVAAGCTPGTGESNIELDPAQPQHAVTTTSIVTTTTIADSPNPIMERFAAAAGGYTPEEIWAAVETQRQDLTRRCVEAEGWTVDESILVPPPTEQDTPGYFGGVVDQFLSELDEMDSAGEPTDVVEPLPKEFWVLLEDCSESAVDVVADPRDALFDWLDQHQEDMAAQFVASPGYVAAEQQFNRCIQATGYDVTDPDEASNQIYERATEALDRFFRGTIPKAQTRDVLTALAAEEQAMADVFTPCYEARVKAEQEIWVGVERAFLEEHGDALALALGEMVESVESLLETLKERSRDG